MKTVHLKRRRVSCLGILMCSSMYGKVFHRQSSNTQVKVNSIQRAVFLMRRCADSSISCSGPPGNFSRKQGQNFANVGRTMLGTL